MKFHTRLWNFYDKRGGRRGEGEGQREKEREREGSKIIGDTLLETLWKNSAKVVLPVLNSTHVELSRGNSYDISTLRILKFFSPRKIMITAILKVI